MASSQSRPLSQPEDPGDVTNADISSSALSDFSIAATTPELITPIEEHYLKRELLDLQIQQEILRFNNFDALERFGSPFKTKEEKHEEVQSKDPETKRHQIERRNSFSVDPSIDERLLSDPYYFNGFEAEFPIFRFIFTKHVITFPFLAAIPINPFFQNKLQPVLESFASKQISSTEDRREETKRHKIMRKLSKGVTIYLAAGLDTTSGLRERDEKVEISKTAEDFANKALLEKSEVSEKNADLKPQNSKGSSTNSSKASTDSNVKFINGVKLNVCGVRRKKVKTGAFSLFTEVHHEFIIESTMKTDQDENSIVTEKGTQRLKNTTFVARRYTEFKELDRKLHERFPGKQLPRLPGKNKQASEIKFDITNGTGNLTNMFSGIGLNSDDNSNANNGDNLDDDAYDDNDDEELVYKRGNTTGTTKLIREKQRMALRYYLHSLCEIVQIAKSPVLWEFLFKDKLVTLSRDERIDIELRKQMDLKRISDQTKFYKVAVQRAKEVEVYMNEFKTEIVKKDGLLRIFNEVKDNESISQLSPMFQNFITWAKIEISATLYSLFISSDNSQEFFTQIKKLHKFFPYMLVKNILRYSNPVAIMKAFIDLFLAQPFGKRSLLQNIFWVILGDDIKSQEKQISEVEAVIKKFSENNRQYDAATCRGYESIGTVVNHYVFKISEETRLKIREKCAQKKVAGHEIDSDLVYAIFVNLDLIFEGENLSDSEKTQIKLAGMIVRNLYLESERASGLKHYKSLHEPNAAATPKEQYDMIKKLLLLNIRKRDKDQLQQLWLEPRLGKLVQEIITIFYTPLIKIFKDGDLHIAIGNFEKFMNDLIKLVEKYNDCGGINNTDQLVEEFNNLLNQHQDNFFQFIHNIYVKDKEGLFDNIMRWMGDILQWIQYSPNKTKIDLQKVVRDGVQSDAVELYTIKQELDSIIKWKLSIKEWHERHILALNNHQNSNGNGPVNAELDWQDAVPLAGLSGADFGFDDNDFLELEAEHISDNEYGDEDDFEHNQVSGVSALPTAKKARAEPPPSKPELVAVPKLLFLFNKELTAKLA
ncbi:hypothetical protein NADFUDRAFT_84264 [Nadsonia fulvescens var. elongata DSM 6958]|uniref:PX domain-containing protein n=1 Tax=Nadsonia fulvescens var. elongata DSM 6958 TaxID=857566 RepID=A0A1E3PFA6_9ASCO|nr:hypothetical protein NADFUDRAFT_84264 [Nadsonia fulvescens var. elongata DSM 6958]